MNRECPCCVHAAPLQTAAMSKSAKMMLRAVGLWFVGLIGCEIVDQRTGRKLGRCLLLPWRGRILMIGDAPRVLPEFRAQSRLTYWRREIVFTTHPEPDFPHEPRA